MKMWVRFVIAGGLGALFGWLIFEPWTQEYGVFRDILLLYGVSLGIALFLILEKYVIHKKFKLVKETLKYWPIYVIPLIGVLFLKYIYGTYEPNNIVGQDQTVETRLFLLDVSGSMKGRPLRELKKALYMYLGVLEEARSRDQIGCVIFESNARVLFRPGTNYSAMKEEISDLSANGGTNMVDAFQEASRQFETTMREKREIILVSDGKPDERQKTLDYVEQLRGIRINTVGVGRNYDRNMLQTIARQTEGEFFPADKVTDLTNVFQKMAVQGLTETSSRGKARLPIRNRLMAWSLLGVCIGLAIGIGNKRKEMIWIGSIGGFLGGLLSSLLFTLLDYIHIASGAYSRMISFILLGVCLGFTIFLINEFFSRLTFAQKTGFKYDEIKE
ncbi:MAG: VWA domain-containing protein [Spirochaetales bacterium]|nr:VWA domain-containing protein [Spirochaetales bacterium]